MASLLFCLSCLLSLLLSSPPCAIAITIPLSRSTTTTTTAAPTFSNSPDPWKTLNQLATASITRAHHLKFPKHNTSLTKTPLYPRGYGGYSVSLSFGTPPQEINFVMDTGSSLVWFPCTHRYACSNCTFPNADQKNISTFIPNLSSTSKILGCRNPKCGLIDDSDVETRCKDCDPSSSSCNQACPAYILQYGSGTTAGLLLLDNLDFPEKIVPDFLVGCSIFSVRQPEGIAGFGRGPISLPAQMGLTKFSYCLVSHNFDDLPRSSDLVLVGGSDSGDEKTPGVSYTPFRKNPKNSNSAFLDYYYVTLRKIIIGNKHVKMPYKFLVPGSDGNGGTIVDSGSTFTFMDSRVFDLVAGEFENQMSNYSRSTDIEARSGLRPCFDVSGEKSFSIPELFFQFKSGSKMALPLANYFSIVGRPDVVCMTIVSTDFVDAGRRGPSIILGNYQQQNYYVEYDLKHERFGFRKQIC